MPKQKRKKKNKTPVPSGSSISVENSTMGDDPGKQISDLIAGLNQIVQTPHKYVPPTGIPFQPFKKGAESFTTYLQRLDNYCSLNDTPEDKKILVLLNCLSPEDYELLVRLTLPKSPKEKTFQELVKLLTEQKDPPPNVIVERYRFGQCVQLEGDNIATYKANLKQASRFCDFNCPECKKNILDMHLLTQFIRGLKDNDIREKLLLEKDLTFEKAVAFAVTIESTKTDSSSMTAGASAPAELSHINQLRTSRKSVPKQNKPTTANSISPNESVPRNSERPKCTHCGWKNHKAIDCKYKDSICKICSKKGHIAPICPQNSKDTTRPAKSVKQLNDEEDSSSCDEMNIYQLQTKSDTRDEIIIHVEVESVSVPMEVDTGARSTVISLRNFKRYLPHISLGPTSRSVKCYFGLIRKLAGVACVSTTFNGISIEQTLYVAEDDVSTVIGRKWLRKFKVIRGDSINLNSTSVKLLKEIDELTDKHRRRLAETLSKRAFLFDGKYGKATKVKCSHPLPSDTRPVYLKARQLPFAINDMVTEEIRSLEKEGIFTQIQHPTWGTPIVPIIKGNRVRICGDYKSTLNHFLPDDVYPIPTVEEILAKLNGGKFFCKLDIFRAYLHLPVDEETAKLQTITTHLGTFRVNRLMFGTKNAPSIWQRYIDQLLGHLDGVTVFFDDIKIQGANPDELLDRLDTVLQILEENGLKLNREKWLYSPWVSHTHPQVSAIKGFRAITFWTSWSC